MTFAPLFTSPCDLAQRLPSMASDFLELESKVGRRFREDSVTDIIIASLLRIAGTNATVLTPPEVKTGGDFDILIVEPSTGDAIQYRIQAKRLTSHPTNWKWGSYRELDHPNGQGKQSSTLIRSSAHEQIKTIPLYAFYNPQSACTASSGRIAGIELADGREINQIVKTLIRAKIAFKRPRLKRVGYLCDLFFPLSTILCSSIDDETNVLSAIVPPRISRAKVETAIEIRRRPEWMWVEGVPQLPKSRGGEPEKLRPPDQTSPLGRGSKQSALAAKPFPPLVERAIDRRPSEEPIVVAAIKRPKLVLISRGTDEP